MPHVKKRNPIEWLKQARTKFNLSDFLKRPSILLGLFFALLNYSKEKHMAQIKLHQLTQDFYDEHSHLHEVSDKNKDGTFSDKGRGYGILMVKVKGYKFAIPLRSKMNHKENFTTKIVTNNKGKRLRKGLDYSKAVIITDERFVSLYAFKIEQDEFLKIAKAENHIIQSFEKYVERYVMAYNTGDSNILKKYGFSTLKNYNQELGCVSLITPKSP